MSRVTVVMGGVGRSLHTSCSVRSLTSLPILTSRWCGVGEVGRASSWVGRAMAGRGRVRRSFPVFIFG